MNFWEQFVINQAQASISTLVKLYGAKYLNPAELAASDVMINALIDLPRRIHSQDKKV